MVRSTHQAKPHRWHRHLYRWAVLPTLLAIIVQLSAPPSGAAEKINPSFVHRVDATCADNLSNYPTSGPFPVPGFDPEHPSVSDLPTVGAYFAKNQRGIVPLKSALKELGSPSAGAIAWQSIRALALSVLADAVAQKKAALAGNARAFVATVRANQRLSSQLQAAAQAAGMHVSGSCSKLF